MTSPESTRPTHRPGRPAPAPSWRAPPRADPPRRWTNPRALPVWQATMARLDAEERIAREPVETRRLTPPEIVDYTRSLPRLWADSGPDGRPALVGPIFAPLRVL